MYDSVDNLLTETKLEDRLNIFYSVKLLLHFDCPPKTY